MEQQLLDKYGGRTIDKRTLIEIIKDIKNYKEPEPKPNIKPDLDIDNILEQIDTMKDKYTGKDLTDITKKNYKSKIIMIDKFIPNIFQLFIDNPNSNPVINYNLKLIRDKYPKSYKDYIIPLSKVITNLKGLDDKISPYIKGRIQQVIKEGNVVSQKRSDDNVDFKPLKITWKEFEKKTNEIRNNDDIPLQVKVLFELYKLLTLRDDFGNVRITDKDLDDNINYYNFKTKILHLNNFKTKKRFGKRRYKLPKYLNKMIEKLFEEQNFLYVNLLPDTLYRNGELSKVITKLTKKYYGIQFNITDMRNARITYSQKKHTIEKQRQVAEIMLHSLEMATQVYNRKENKKK